MEAKNLTHEEKLSSLHPLEVKFLHLFKKSQRINDKELKDQKELSESQIRTAVEWLKLKEAIEVKTVESQELVSLTETGEIYATSGTPELRIIEACKSLPQPTVINIQSLLTDLSQEEIGTAIGNLKKSEIIDFRQGEITVNIGATEISELNKTQQFLKELLKQKTVNKSSLGKWEEELINTNSKKRGKAKGIFRSQEIVVREYLLLDNGIALLDLLLSQGVTGEEIGELTPQLLTSGEWNGRKFRGYNLMIRPPWVVTGRSHSYREYLDFVKERLISLGFEEMTGSFIESEFWDMDALFMPQFHSARDIHDVYFLKEPTHTNTIPSKLIKAVSDTHEKGGKTGSRGWGYKFDQHKTQRLVLRSQTTALSARKLADSPKIPGKYFAIARCFRYDQVDASHAPDFFQVEGIVLDPNTSFKELLGLLKIFATEIAKAKEMKFVPAYFPFTEPSVEVHMKHPKLGWIELGGAGIFRPEVTKPLGVEAPVLAWGLGIDRMAMVALGINDIRNLFSSDLDLLRQSRIKGIL